MKNVQSPAFIQTGGQMNNVFGREGSLGKNGGNVMLKNCLMLYDKYYFINNLFLTVC